MAYNGETKQEAPRIAPETPRDTPSKRGIVKDSTDIERPEPARQIALIRSLVAYAQGYEDRALAEIRDVLDGATLADIMTRRPA